MEVILIPFLIAKGSGRLENRRISNFKIGQNTEESPGNLK